MSTQKSGLDIAREKNEAIKASIAKDKQIQVNASSLIAQADLSEEVMAYMAQKAANSSYEDLNTGVSAPQLRIHSAGNSTKNQLEDGSDPEDGQIFYTGTKEAWDMVPVILLAIKKCRLQALDDNGEVVLDDDGEPVYKANYLLAGVIDGSLKPFMMYVKGMSYNKIWELEDQLKPFVTKRKGGIPLNMVKILVSSTKERVEKGRYAGQLKNVFRFSLKMTTNGFPVLETNLEYLNQLDQATESAEQMLEDVISRKGMSEKDWNIRKNGGEELVSAARETFSKPEKELEDFKTSIENNNVQDVDPDDIPF